MGRQLRDNLLGRRVWEAMEPATRAFLSSAEAVYRARRDDPKFDHSGPAVEYAKAVETELNALVFGALGDALGGRSSSERRVRADGRTLDVADDVSHQSLGTLQHLIEHDGTVRNGLKQALGNDATWVLNQLPYRLKPVREMRNPAAHAETVNRRHVGHQRERILGIGQEGLINRIVRSKRSG